MMMMIETVTVAAKVGSSSSADECEDDIADPLIVYPVSPSHRQWSAVGEQQSGLGDSELHKRTTQPPF